MAVVVVVVARTRWSSGAAWLETLTSEAAASTFRYAKHAQSPQLATPCRKSRSTDMNSDSSSKRRTHQLAHTSAQKPSPACVSGEVLFA